MEITSADQWTAEVAKKVSMTIIAMFDETGLQEARDGSSEAISILKQIAADNPDAPFRFAYMAKAGQGRMLEVFDVMHFYTLFLHKFDDLKLKCLA